MSEIQSVTDTEEDHESCSSFSPQKEIPEQLRSREIGQKSKLLIEYLKRYDEDQIYVFDYTHITFEEKCCSWRQSVGCCEVCKKACEKYLYSILQLLNGEQSKDVYKDNMFIYVCMGCVKEYFYDRENGEEDVQLIWAEFKNGQIATSIEFYDNYPLIRQE